MLHRLLFEPYASPAAEARAEALQNSLADLDEGVLLLNLLLDEELLDAVLLLPQGVAVLRLLPGGQELSASALAHGPWLLDGQLLPDFAGADNPYQQLQRQRPALAAWLAEQPLLPTIAPETIKAMAVFAGVRHFGAGLEAQLRKLPTDEQFQLVRQPGLVLRSFQHMPAEKTQRLSAATLDAWAAALLQTEDVPAESDASEPEADETDDDLLTRKARQLWRWLGAEDVPADPPYGTAAPAPAPDPMAASQQEKRRLEQIRQQIRVEVSEQTQALQTREAARDQTIAQLRQQLADSAAAAPETARLQARLATEAREKAALEEAIRVARMESETRNRDLDARIQLLGQQLQQLQERPVPAIAPLAAPVAAAVAAAVPMEAPTTATPATTAPAAIRTVAPTGRMAASRPKTPRPLAAPIVWRLQWPRVLLAGLLLSVMGTAVWGVTQLPGWLRNPENARPAATSIPRASGNEEAAAPTQPDTIQLTPTEIEADSAAAAEEQTILAADSLVMPAPANEVMDSVVAPPDDM